MKPGQITRIVFIVTLVIQYTSAAGCRSKNKCKKNGGTCTPLNKCASGFTKVPNGCKGKKCTCCTPKGCQCGQSNPSRVVGGQVVSPKYKYPWQVWLKNNNFYLCGGSIINDRYILTAAHCLVDYNDCSTLRPKVLKVIVADHNKDSEKDDVAVTMTVSVANVIMHPSYICGLLNDDIALLKLSKTLNLSSQREQPVCLPQDDSKSYTGEKAVVTGWGYTSGGGPELPSLLHEVEVPVIDCPGVDDYGEELTPKMLCAGVPEGGKDACNGDSGGPLVIKENNSRYVQVGIVSFGPLECTGPGIYTRISKYIKWIKKKTKKALSCDDRSRTDVIEPHKILFTGKNPIGAEANKTDNLPLKTEINALEVS